MALELRKVKIHDDMSEETTCFSAEMWEDGVHIGWVKNEGFGGCDNITPKGDHKDKAYAYMEDYRKDFNRENFPIPFLLNDWDAATRYQGKNLVFRGTDEEYYTINFGKLSISAVKKNPKGMAKINEVRVREESKGSVLLNRNI